MSISVVMEKKSDLVTLGACWGSFLDTGLKEEQTGIAALIHPRKMCEGDLPGHGINALLYLTLSHSILILLH